MKISLEEARKRATPGPLETRAGLADHVCLYVQGTTVNVAVGMRPANAVLLAHCWNRFDEVLAAVEEEREARTQFELGWRLDTKRLEQAQENLARVLQRAKEVEMP